MQVSLDGFVADSTGDLSWMWRAFDKALKDSIVTALGAFDTYLMGRVNYVGQAAQWPTSTDEIASLMNAATKVVFSRTLDRVDWANARLATHDVAEEIAMLRRQPGKDIAVSGGARFAQHVSRLGLIDEYDLIVHPVALGAGLPLFGDGGHPLPLDLIESERFDTGVVRMRYRPAPSL
jgi:dihydrofolate reductase